MRVLVADDHSLFRDGIISLLEAAGFEPVGQVGDGHAAVEATRRLRPDLVLMDIQLPERDGFSLLQDIRRDVPATRVVALTAHAMAGDRERAIGAGFDEYITKPIDIRAFPAQIAAALQKRSPG